MFAVTFVSSLLATAAGADNSQSRIAENRNSRLK